MARTINRLTPGSIKTLPAGLHPDGGGLYLRIDASGSKRWVYLFQWRGRRKEMGLGSFVAVPLAAARKAAAAARQLVAEGHNRIEERRAARTSGMTFGEFADQYVTDQQPSWKSAKHISQWRYSVEQDAKSLRPIPIADITTEDVVRVLKPIWLTKAASRTGGTLLQNKSEKGCPASVQFSVLGPAQGVLGQDGTNEPEDCLAGLRAGSMRTRRRGSVTGGRPI